MGWGPTTLDGIGWSPVPEAGGGGGGGGISLITGGITAPTSDYSHAVGATLSGGVLNGFRLQIPGAFTSIEEKAGGWIEFVVDYTVTGQIRWGESASAPNAGPAMLLPVDVIGPGYIETQIDTPANVAHAWAGIGPAFWSGDTSSETGLIHTKKGSGSTITGSLKGYSRGNNSTGPTPVSLGSAETWANLKHWLKLTVTGQDVVFSQDSAAGAPTYNDSAPKRWDRAGAVRHIGVAFSGENLKTETWRMYALNWSYYPAP